MKNHLSLPDIINLEYLFHEDAARSPAVLHQRDRKIALALQQTGCPATPAAKLQGWLRARLPEEFPGAASRSPGEIFSDSLRFAGLIAIIKGGLLGAAAGLAFFSYSGTTPVNVFQFLLLFVVSQLLLVALLLVGSLLRGLLPGLPMPRFYSLFLERSFGVFSRWLRRGWLSRIDAGRRASINHAFAVTRMNSRRYGRLFYWPFFCLAQSFGLTFNIALVVTTLIKIATSDLAFGWQSTMQFSDAAVHRAVQLLALPWSWLLGSNAAPDLAAIAGSRIVLKDGIYHLATADLTSWWPFLVMCLLVYGVLVRLLFLLFGRMMDSHVLRRLPLTTIPQYRGLLQRMTTPQMTTQAPEEKRVEAASWSSASRPTVSPAPPGEEVPASSQLVLVGVDLYDQLQQPVEEVSTAIAPTGITPIAVEPVQAGWEEDHRLLDRIREQWPEKDGVLLIVEGWMVPLVDLLSWLGELRAVLPGRMIISIALVGRPAATLFTPVTKRDFTIWQQKVEALADPWLHLFPLLGREDD